MGDLSHLSLEEVFDFMRKSPLPHYQKLLNVRFKVGRGPDKNVIMCHEAFLAAKCQHFYRIFEGDNVKVEFVQNKEKDWILKEVELPELSPKGFQLLIEHMYTGKIETSNLSVVLDAMECARKMEYTELLVELGFCLKTIVTKDGFLNLSEGNLCTLLESDEWTLDSEVKVFELVKRWASHKVNPENPSVKVSGTELRRQMGRALYGIRFPLFSLEDTLQLFACPVNSTLLNTEEMCKLMSYVSQRELDIPDQEKAPLPLMFVARPRGTPGKNVAQNLELMEIAAETEAETGQGDQKNSRVSKEAEVATEPDNEIIKTETAVETHSTPENAASSSKSIQRKPRSTSAKRRQYACYLCTTTFRTVALLEDHLNTHTGAKPYKCQYCSKIFGSKAGKTKHEKVHHQENQFQYLN